jgi:hypothetical protein
MDAWRNAKEINDLRSDIEKEVTALKRDFRTLYDYVHSLSLEKPKAAKKKEPVK